MQLLALALLALTACLTDDEALRYYDRDLDGSYVQDAAAFGATGPFDCDDTNPDIHPDAEEICDGIDNDCDEQLDDGTDRINVYLDADADGYGISGAADKLACFAQVGWSARGDDCDDERDTVYPDAPEICDELDNDCDDQIDETAPTLYGDADGDGYGVDSDTIEACVAPDGYADAAGDCDDTDSAVNPGAQEVCSGVDDDCDGLVDADDPTMTGLAVWYVDADSDGYGQAADTQDSCEQPTGYVRNDDDCDDTTAAISPAGDEICDDIDNDCDSAIDDADSSLTGAPVWYADTDGDLYGDPDATTNACIQPANHVANSDDCDDADGDINPDGIEMCGGADEDCDSLIDEDDATDASTWYLDSDADGYGDPEVTATACSAPTDHVADNTDCDDSTSTISPDGAEICNGVDDDCDGTPDDSAADALAWYVDTDGDSYGEDATLTRSCTSPGSSSVLSGGDCDETDPAVHPGSIESCDSVDSNCDGRDADFEVPASQPTIQSAITTAADGDIICIAPGTYTENLSLGGKAISLIGTEGSELTIIDGSAGSQRVLYIGSDGTASPPLIQGVTLTAGSASSGDGSGVSIADSDVILRDVIVEANSCTAASCRGVGVFVASGSPTIENCVIRANSCTGVSTSFSSCYGSGIYVQSTASVSLIDSDVSSNDCALTTGWCRGTVHVATGGLLEVDRSHFNENKLGTSSSAWGAAIDVDGGTLDINNSRIRDNVISADIAHGGAISGNDAIIHLENALLLKNVVYSPTSSATGGALSVESSSVTLMNVDLMGNTAMSDDGSTTHMTVAHGGALFSADSTIQLSNTGFYNNSVSAESTTGDVISDSSSTFTTSYCNFFGNGASPFYGASNPVGANGNISVNPEFVDTTGADTSLWDLHLQSTSGLIDAGDPAILDPDGTTSDIGAYGGPGAGAW